MNLSLMDASTSGSGQFDHDILLSYYRIMTKFMISNRVDA